MKISDASIIALIELLNNHYQTNIANRFMRPLLLQLPVKKWVWDTIDSFVQNASLFDYQQFNYNDLYQQLLAFSHFILVTRRQLLPGLRNHTLRFSGPDKILMDMAVNTFPSNINLLADYTKQLYSKLVEFDKANATSGELPPYLQYVELADMMSYL
ncbi:MAG: hypothetical protein LBD58_13670 [Treponema sp.]|jgi:hypothetical protein|nr:hypothetical protein [Treponema sp.]